MDPTEAAASTPIEPCTRCLKPGPLCVCDRVEALSVRTRVLVLQHPQEHDAVLGTAHLATLALARCKLTVGLSWASLAAALGEPADPKQWAVLYLGSLRKPLTEAQKRKPLVLLDREGEELNPRRQRPAGIVLLDGSWSQAKTLWWRNAWMLKLGRVLLHPAEPSAYGRLRKQSQRDHLATLEALALTLDGLGEDAAVKTSLMRLFRTLCQRARDHEELLTPLPAEAEGEGKSEDKGETKASPAAPKRKRRRPPRGGGPEV